VPIVGCEGHTLVPEKGRFEWPRYQGDRHHGPDKNVLNNTPGVNLHAICKQCHNRWHELNDAYYATPRPSAGSVWTPSEGYYLHDPLTPSTDDDLLLSEDWWSLEPGDRDAYPVVPENARLILPTTQTLATLPHNPFTPERNTTS
jgi:hypothetical protein